MAAKRVKSGLAGAAGAARVADATGVMRGSFTVGNGASPAAGQGSRARGKAAETAARAERFAAWLEACPPEWRELFDAP